MKKNGLSSGFVASRKIATRSQELPMKSLTMQRKDRRCASTVNSRRKNRKNRRRFISISGVLFIRILRCYHSSCTFYPDPDV